MPPSTRQEIDKMVASILEEIEESGHGRSLLSRDTVRAVRSEVIGAIKAGAEAVEPDAPKKGELYVGVANALYDRLEASVVKQGGAVSGTVVYSAAARAASHGTHGLLNSNRKILGDRLGNVPAADAYRKQCGVGAIFDPEAPVEMLDFGNQQLVVFEDPKFAALAEARDIDVVHMRKKLAPAVKELKALIEAGLGTTPRRGEATGDVHENLLAIEILVSRAASWMRTYGNPDGAELLERKLPKRHGRRSTDRKAAETTPVEVAPAVTTGILTPVTNGAPAHVPAFETPVAALEAVGDKSA